MLRQRIEHASRDRRGATQVGCGDHDDGPAGRLQQLAATDVVLPSPQVACMVHAVVLHDHAPESVDEISTGEELTGLVRDDAVDLRLREASEPQHEADDGLGR